MLNIHYFASLREELGQGSEALTMPTGVASVSHLIRHLVHVHGDSWRVLEDSSRVLVAVDQTIVDRTHPLQGSEEVAFFPPMTGG